jgi:hypothetical protein
MTEEELIEIVVLPEGTVAVLQLKDYDGIQIPTHAIIFNNEKLEKLERV